MFEREIPEEETKEEEEDHEEVEEEVPEVVEEPEHFEFEEEKVPDKELVCLSIWSISRNSRCSPI